MSDLLAILSSQKNQLIALIQSSKLNLNKFEIAKDGSFYKYQGTDYFFYFKRGPQHRPVVHYSPGLHQLEYATEINFETFVHPAQEFYNWLENLEREINEPDLFEILINQGDSIQILNENSLFSPEEVTHVRAKVQEIRKDFSTSDFTKQQLKEINRKLDESIELLQKLTKSQWKSYFIGSLISLALNAVIPIDMIATIWDKIKYFFIRLALGT